MEQFPGTSDRRYAPYDLGVFRSVVAERFRKGTEPLPGYVKRDVDNTLDAALRRACFVLIVGPSKSGKSRTAFEACRRHFNDHRLIACSHSPSTATHSVGLLRGHNKAASASM